MKSDDSTFGYVSVNALMEFARNHVDRKVDCNDIARFPRSNVRNADEQQSLQQIFGIPFARLRELAEAERDGRIVVHKYPSCYACPKLPKSNLWQNNEPCKSCHDRALAAADAGNATEPKGDATCQNKD